MTVVSLDKFKKSKKVAQTRASYREEQLKELANGIYLTHDFLTGLVKILRRYEKDYAPVKVDIRGKSVYVERCVMELIKVHDKLLEKYIEYVDV